MREVANVFEQRPEGFGGGFGSCFVVPDLSGEFSVGLRFDRTFYLRDSEGSFVIDAVGEPRAGGRGLSGNSSIMNDDFRLDARDMLKETTIHSTMSRPSHSRRAKHLWPLGLPRAISGRSTLACRRGS